MPEDAAVKPQVRHPRRGVMAALYGSVALGLAALCLLWVRARTDFVQGEEAFARCSGLSDQARKPACFAAAERHYRSAIRNFPLVGAYYAGLGRSAEAAGDTRSAERAFRKARILGYRR